MPRAEVAVINILKCRPPGNRRPLPVEMANCRGWLDRQLALIDPAVIVGLGLTAIAGLWDGAATAKKSDFVLRLLRERPLTAGGYPFLATYHPSGALRYGPNGAPDAGAARRPRPGPRHGRRGPHDHAGHRRRHSRARMRASPRSCDPAT